MVNGYDFNLPPFRELKDRVRVSAKASPFSFFSPIPFDLCLKLRIYSVPPVFELQSDAMRWRGQKVDSSGEVSFEILGNLPPTKLHWISIGSSCNFLFLILSSLDISCFSRFFCLLLAAVSRDCLFFRSYRSSTFAFRFLYSSSLTVEPCPSSLLSLLTASSCTHCNSSLSELHHFRAWKELSTLRFLSCSIVREFSARLLRLFSLISSLLFS